jgi:hypothetical protein
MLICTITGTVFEVNGSPLAGVQFRVTTVISPGSFITTEDKIFTSNGSGVVTIPLPRGSMATLAAPIEGLTEGVTITVPNTATATLESLIPPPSVVTVEGFNFLALGDAPDTYEDQAGKAVVVNDDESGLEFADVALLSGAAFSGNVTFNGQTAAALNDAGNSGTAKTINWNDSNKQLVTLTGNVTFTFTSPLSGASYTLLLKQDGTGPRLATWPASVLWPGGTAPTLSTAAGKVDVVTFVYDDVDGKYYGGFSIGY